MNSVQLTDHPEVLTVTEAAGVLRLSRNGAYAAVQAGHLPVIRMGRRILVPRAALERLLCTASTSALVDEVGGHASVPNRDFRSREHHVKQEEEQDGEAAVASS